MRGRQKLRSLVTIAAVLATLNAGGAHLTPPAPPDPPQDNNQLIFPVVGDHNYTDTFGAPRSGGRTHKGTDIFAEKLTPVVAVADGTVVKIAIGKLAGRYIVVKHVDGWLSYYLHLNNDTPGTDDGLGGEGVAGIVVGAEVEAGDLLDVVGDSGNAEGTPPHLHFELHKPDGTAVNPYSYLLDAQGIAAPEVAMEEVTLGAGWAPEYDAVNTAMVGNFDPGGGFTADVVVHGSTAYLGTWGRPGLCPNTGIRMIEVVDPEQPDSIGVFADHEEFPGTAAETLWVGSTETPFFAGDLAVVALRLCDNEETGRWNSTFRGLAFYDVTDTTAPMLLSTWGSGDRTQGANAVSVQQRADGMLLVATTVRQSFLHTEEAVGDVRFIDATNPSLPVELSDWDNRRDGRTVIGEYDEEEFHAHAVELSSDGLTAWVSHWDAGTVLVDLKDPTAPSFVSAVGFMPEGEGNRHTSVYDEANALLIVNEEDLYPSESDVHVDGWGIQHIYDVSDPTAPIEIAHFATERSTEDGIGFDGIYSAHDTVLSGTLAITSWYSDGIRIVNLSDPAHPMEVGSFVPPRSRDPIGYWVAPNGATAFPMVWGVDLQDDLIYASDMNSGLWIVRLEADTSTAASPAPCPNDGSLGWPAPGHQLPAAI